jgi:hypothetical protein
MTVTVQPFDASLHSGQVSKAGNCGQGGRDTCSKPPEFSVGGDHYNVAACNDHLTGAVRQAMGMPPRRRAS